MRPKSLVLVFFRIFKVFFALVARETEFARVFDLHLLPEQDQLDVVSVCVVVFDLTNIFVVINPPVWRYKLFWLPVHFFVSVTTFITSTNTTQKFTRTQFTYHLSFRRIFWSVHLIEFSKAFLFLAVGCHRLVLADVGSFCSHLLRFFWCTIALE